MFKKLFSLFLIALILISGCTPGTSSSAGSFLPSKTADTSARELYAPNVRQLCGDPAYYTDNSEVSLYRFPVIDDNSPYIIDSAESYREFISNHIVSRWEDHNAVPIWDFWFYGFDLSTIRVSYDGTVYKNETVMDLDTLRETYDDAFFSDRILAALPEYTSDSAVKRMLTVIWETDKNELMIFPILIASRHSTPTLMSHYEVIKFVALDRRFVEGKTVLPVTDERIVALRKEWCEITAQCETDADSDALLRETYGDKFDYIEPWVLKTDK